MTLEPVFVPGPVLPGPVLPGPASGTRPGLLCDRDGTIIEDRPRYVRELQDIVLLPGAIGALRQAARRGFTIVLVSNQSVVGRGILALSDVVRLHEMFVARLSSAGVPVAGSYLCPHAPQAGCGCRKPGPGMVLAAQTRFALDPGRSFLIGDALRDVAAARHAGVRGILVRTGHGHRAEQAGATELGRHGTLVANDLPAAVAAAVQALDRGAPEVSSGQA